MNLLSNENDKNKIDDLVNPNQIKELYVINEESLAGNFQNELFSDNINDLVYDNGDVIKESIKNLWFDANNVSDIYNVIPNLNYFIESFESELNKNNSLSDLLKEYLSFETNTANLFNKVNPFKIYCKDILKDNEIATTYINKLSSLESAVLLKKNKFLEYFQKALVSSQNTRLSSQSLLYNNMVLLSNDIAKIQNNPSLFEEYQISFDQLLNEKQKLKKYLIKLLEIKEPAIYNKTNIKDSLKNKFWLEEPLLNTLSQLVFDSCITSNTEFSFKTVVKNTYEKISDLLVFSDDAIFCEENKKMNPIYQKKINSVMKLYWIQKDYNKVFKSDIQHLSSSEKLQLAFSLSQIKSIEASSIFSSITPNWSIQKVLSQFSSVDEFQNFKQNNLNPFLEKNTLSFYKMFKTDNDLDISMLPFIENFAVWEKKGSTTWIDWETNNYWTIFFNYNESDSLEENLSYSRKILWTQDALSFDLKPIWFEWFDWYWIDYTFTIWWYVLKASLSDSKTLVWHNISDCPYKNAINIKWSQITIDSNKIWYRPDIYFETNSLNKDEVLTLFITNGVAIKDSENIASDRNAFYWENFFELWKWQISDSWKKQLKESFKILDYYTNKDISSIDYIPVNISAGADYVKVLDTEKYISDKNENIRTLMDLLQKKGIFLSMDGDNNLVTQSSENIENLKDNQIKEINNWISYLINNNMTDIFDDQKDLIICRIFSAIIYILDNFPDKSDLNIIKLLKFIPDKFIQWQQPENGLNKWNLKDRFFHLYLWTPKIRDIT